MARAATRARTDRSPKARGESHWERVYRSRGEEELSWHQDAPTRSLALIRQVGSPGSRIIDVGGGSSELAGRLVQAGFGRVTVLDVSPTALGRARSRAGRYAPAIRWIVHDLTAAGPLGRFDVWHDRATFHFLTGAADRAAYVERARRAIPLGGHLVVATFAPDGPARCSGLDVVRYDGPALAAVFSPGFALRREVRESHRTPWGTRQSFVYAVFERVASSPSRAARTGMRRPAGIAARKIGGARRRQT